MCLSKSVFYRFIAVFMIAVSAVCGLEGCSPEDDVDYMSLEKLGLYEVGSSVKPEVKGRVSLVSNKVDTFNPLQTRNFYVSSFLNLIYEPLFKTDSKMSAVPVLASDAVAAEDNKQWTVFLNENVSWHDGKQFTADDVVYTFRILMDDDYSGPYKKYVNSISKVKSSNNSVIFYLKQSNPVFLYNLSIPIISSNHISRKTALNADLSRQIKPIGTGPYKFSKKTKDGYQLNRNTEWHVADGLEDEYEGVRPPFIKKIDLFVYNDFSDSQTALLKNEIDIFPTDESREKSALTGAGFNISAITTNMFDCISVNHNSGIFGDVNVRRALSCFIDRNAVIGSCYDIRMAASEFAVLPSEKTWTQLRYPYSIANAKKYLGDSGWKRETYSWRNNNGKYLSFRLLVGNDNKAHKKIAEVLKTNLANNGIGVTIEYCTRKNLNSRLKTGNYDAALVRYTLPTNPDFTPFYASKKYCGYLNYTNYSNKELDRLISEWKVEPDATTRANLYVKMRNIVSDEIPIIGLASSSARILYSRRICGSLDPVNRYAYGNLAFCYIA